MTMSPSLRKFMLTVHVVVSVGWIGALVAYLALIIAGLILQDDQTRRAALIGMKLIGWYIIVPLAAASLLTGLVMSLGTKWVLFRHYWVLFSFVLTVAAIPILLRELQIVSLLADVAARMDNTTGVGLRTMARAALPHPAVGLLVLLLIQVLNMYKPRALTPYGWRQQQRARAARRPLDAAT